MSASHKKETKCLQSRIDDVRLLLAIILQQRHKSASSSHGRGPNTPSLWAPWQRSLVRRLVSCHTKPSISMESAKSILSPESSSKSNSSPSWRGLRRSSDSPCKNVDSWLVLDFMEEVSTIRDGSSACGSVSCEIKCPRVSGFLIF